MKEEEKKKFNLNIYLGYIIGTLMWGRFFIPVIALFYIASKVPLEQFAIIMSVFAFTTLVLEVPTGVVADLLGKKKTLILSRLMYIIEIFILSFCNGFWPFLIAKIISGVGVSLGSGTTNALLFDTLKKLKKKKDYKKIMGKQSFITNLSMAFTFIFGAYLFTINPKLPAILSLFPIVLGFILTFFITEPYLSKKKLNILNSWKHLKYGLSHFFKNPRLIYFALINLSVGATISMILSLSSAYFGKISIPIFLIGVVSFVGSLITAFSAKKAYLIEKVLGEKKSLFIIQFLVIFSVSFMSFLFPYWGLIFYLIISLTQGFYGVIIGDYINNHVDTEHRATMLSINNMFDNVGITLIFPILGIINKNYSMNLAFLSLSLFLIIYSVLVWVYHKKSSIRNNQKPLPQN